MSFIVEFKFEIGDKVRMISCGEEGFVTTAAISGDAGTLEYFVRDVIGAEECRWFSEDQLTAVES